MVSPNRVYFNLTDMYVGYFDLDTGEAKYFGNRHPLAPLDPYGWTYSWGVPNILPNGRLFVRLDVVTNESDEMVVSTPMGFAIDADLNPNTIDLWYGHIIVNGGILDNDYVPADMGAGGAIDGGTILLQWTDASNTLEIPAYSLTRFDSGGNVVAQYGNVANSQFSYTYAMGSSYEVHDGFFWRTANIQSELHRVPLDGGEITTCGPGGTGPGGDYQRSLLYIAHYGGKIWFVEMDAENIYGGGGTGGSPIPYLVSFLPSQFTWHDMDESNQGFDFIGPAVDVVDITSPLGTDTYRYDTTLGQKGQSARRRDNYIYYIVHRSNLEQDWGAEEGGNGLGFGSASRVHRVNLDTLVRESIFDIPYSFLDGDGSVMRADENYYEETHFNFYGLDWMVTSNTRMMVNVGDEDDREWKFFNPQAGENGGFGVGFINAGTDDNRNWVQVRDLTTLEINTGDDDNREWVIGNT